MASAKSRIIIYGLAGLLVVGAVLLVGYYSLMSAIQTGPTDGPKPPSQQTSDSTVDHAGQSIEDANAGTPPRPPALPLKPVPRLSREETLGLALFSFYPRQRELLHTPVDGAEVIADMSVDRVGAPARVDAKLLPELRVLASSPGLPGNATGLILMLGHVGEAPESELAKQAIQAYAGRCLANDPEAWHRLDAWMQAIALMASRQVPGAQDLLWRLITPEAWAEIGICDCGLPQTPESGADINVDLSRRQLAAGIAAGVPGLCPAVEYALATYASKHGNDMKYEAYFVQSIQLAGYIKPGSSAPRAKRGRVVSGGSPITAAPMTAAHKSASENPPTITVLNATYKEHADLIAAQLKSAVDYRSGLLSTAPGKPRP